MLTLGSCTTDLIGVKEDLITQAVLLHFCLLCYTVLHCVTWLHIPFFIIHIWKKISVGGIVYFTVYVHPYFLPFWYPYILLQFFLCYTVLHWLHYCVLFLQDYVPSCMLDVLHRGELLDVDVVKYARQVAFAVEYLHSQNVLHCDLAARNISYHSKCA